MAKKHLVAFISEQPIYNLLPIRNIKPGAVLFVGTRDRHVTNQHLHTFVSDECDVHQTEVHDPYEPTEIYKTLSKKIRKLNWNPEKVLIDMSGGNTASTARTIGMCNCVGRIPTTYHALRPWASGICAGVPPVATAKSLSLAGSAPGTRVSEAIQFATSDTGRRAENSQIVSA